MVAADAIAIAIGAFFGTRLPERAIALFAAGAFVLFGVILIAEGPGLVWGSAQVRARATAAGRPR